MDNELKERFLTLWTKHFGGAALPICLFYSNDDGYEQLTRPTRGHACMVGQLAAVREGRDVSFTAGTLGCEGGRRYLGFQKDVRPGFEHFLSCGIPGRMAGERYKKTPDLVRQMVRNADVFEAPAKYAVFRRWDNLLEPEVPEVVIFLAPPDVLSGLFTLAGFDEADLNAVIAPFGAGCATIAQYPYLERTRPVSRAVIGMFDVSARPCVPAGVLSFAVPVNKFRSMVDNMDESFLVTDSWSRVRRRIDGLAP